MKLYNITEFTISGLTTILAPLIKERESITFQLDKLESQINNIKKESFKDLYVYETMKKTDKALIPNKDVLVQIKMLERNSTYIEFKKIIEIYKKQLKDVDFQIEYKKKQTANNFSFESINYDKYLTMFDNVLQTEDTKLLDNLMLEICNNEFNNKKLYWDLKWTRNYSVFLLLVENAPQEYRPLIQYILDYRKIFDDLFDDDYFKLNPNDTLTDLLTEFEIEFNKESA